MNHPRICTALYRKIFNFFLPRTNEKQTFSYIFQRSCHFIFPSLKILRFYYRMTICVAPRCFATNTSFYYNQSNSSAIISDLFDFALNYSTSHSFSRNFTKIEFPVLNVGEKPRIFKLIMMIGEKNQYS